MASLTINVTPEELENSATVVEGKIGEYNQAYNKLYQEVETMGATWKGEANQRYVEQINGFKDDFQRLEQILREYVKVINDAAKKYRTAENKLRDDAGRLSTGR
jgi:WXG100 family type VII secretion target